MNIIFLTLLILGRESTMDYEEMKKKAGKRIKELREKNSETQNDLAKILSTTQNNISKIENGTIGLTFDKMLLLSEHYNISLDYLCKGIGGVDLLDTLGKYIRFSYSSRSGIFSDADTEKKHPIPVYEIDCNFSHYLAQIAHADYIHRNGMPTNAKDLWIKQAKENFLDTLKSNDSKYIAFVPLEESIFTENEIKNNADIIKLLERHYCSNEYLSKIM